MVKFNILFDDAGIIARSAVLFITLGLSLISRLSLNTMAGYSGTPLTKKLGIKENNRLAIWNAPAYYLKLIADRPENAEIIKNPQPQTLNFVQIFVTNQPDLLAGLRKAKPLLVKNGMLWICWPKGKSEIPSSINREDVRAEGLAIGLVDVKVAAIDDDWSGLKFVYRTKDR